MHSTRYDLFELPPTVSRNGFLLRLISQKRKGDWKRCLTRSWAANTWSVISTPARSWLTGLPTCQRARLSALGARRPGTGANRQRLRTVPRGQSS
jgi:hypothetical protein